MKKIPMSLNDNTFYKGLVIFYTTLSYCGLVIEKGMHNYFGYVDLKRSLDRREARIQEILAIPEYERSSHKQSELDEWQKEQVSVAADLKKFKWTAKFVERFPPES